MRLYLPEVSGSFLISITIRFKFDEMVYVTNTPSKENLDKIFNSKHITKRLDTNMVISMTSYNNDINIFFPAWKVIPHIIANE